MKREKQKEKKGQHLVKFYRGECLGSPHTGYGPGYGFDANPIGLLFLITLYFGEKLSASSE